VLKPTPRGGGLKGKREKGREIVGRQKRSRPLPGSRLPGKPADRKELAEGKKERKWFLILRNRRGRKGKKGGNS